MLQAKIGTDSEHLLLTSPELMDPPLRSLAAELHLGGLSASVVVVHHYAFGFRDLDDFFKLLADDWRGWEGVRGWNSLEGDLSIEARHDGHVQLRVAMRNDLSGWGWSATGDLTIEPGEQLMRVTADVKVLTAGWRPHLAIRSPARPSIRSSVRQLGRTDTNWRQS